jgi:cobalamin biosynthesis Mg chelatase CobN
LANACLSLDPTKKQIPRLLSCAAKKVAFWYYRKEFLPRRSDLPDACRRLARSFVDLTRAMKIQGFEVGYLGIPEHEVNRVTFEANGQVYSYIIDVGESLIDTTFYPYTNSALSYRASHGEELPARESAHEGYNNLASFFNSKKPPTYGSVPTVVMGSIPMGKK